MELLVYKGKLHTLHGYRCITVKSKRTNCFIAHQYAIIAMKYFVNWRKFLHLEVHTKGQKQCRCKNSAPVMKSMRVVDLF